MAVLWVVAQCSLIEIYRRFRGAYFLHHRPDDGGSKELWNVGKLLPDYTTQQQRRQPSSYSPPWEPEFLLIKNCLKSSMAQDQLSYLSILSIEHAIAKSLMCLQLLKQEYLHYNYRQMVMFL
jgi:hypothetical protein